MRELNKNAADKWLNDPDNLSNRFSGNVHLTREEALRIHAEKFGKSTEGDLGGTPGEAAAVPARMRDDQAPSVGVVLEDGIEHIEDDGIEILPPRLTNMTPAEQAECAILALQIGPAEAARLMSVSDSRAARLGQGTGGSDLVKDVVEATLARAREKAAGKLEGALDGISLDKLKPTEAVQVAVGLATVIEKVENRGRKDKGVAIVYRTAGRKVQEYDEVELRVGVSA